MSASARDGDLRPPVWLGSSRAPFSPLWLLLPCFRKIPASVLLAPTCRHNRFPTATAFADSLAASRRTNSQLGQIVHSCIIRWQSALQVSNQTLGGTRSGKFLPALSAVVPTLLVTMPDPLCSLAVTGNVDYGVDNRTGRDGNQVR